MATVGIPYFLKDMYFLILSVLHQHGYGSRSSTVSLANFGISAVPKKLFIINILNSLSGMFFLDSNSLAAAFPTTYLRSGLSELIAFNITIDTSSGSIEPLSTIDLLLASLISTSLA